MALWEDVCVRRVWVLDVRRLETNVDDDPIRGFASLVGFVVRRGGLITYGDAGGIGGDVWLCGRSK